MKLSLGTVQFGLDYGITNKNGAVAQNEVGKILELANQNGIRKLDTAIAYGASESVLGKFDLSDFDVITKIPPMHSSSEEIDSLVISSLERLNINKLYGIMLHNEDDVFINSSEHLTSLSALKNQNVVEKVGASFYSPEKAIAAIESGVMDIIQIPANVLDNRFESLGVYEAALQNNVEIHVRSLFLQGLLAVNAFGRPEKFKLHSDLLKFDETCKKLGLTALETALMHLSRKEYISYGVVGCINQEQLKQITEAYRKVTLLGDIEIPNLSSLDDFLLNPSTWSQIT